MPRISTNTSSETSTKYIYINLDTLKCIFSITLLEAMGADVNGKCFWSNFQFSVLEILYLCFCLCIYHGFEAGGKKVLLYIFRKI